MRRMMLDSLPDLYEYEQLRGAVKYGRSELRALIEQADVNQSLRGKGNRATNTGSGQRQQQGGSTCARHQHQNGKQGSKNNQHGDGQRKPKRDRKKKTCHRCNEIGHFQADCTAIIDGVAGPGAAATCGGNTRTNVGTQRRQQRSNYTSRDGEVRADRRGVAEDDLGVAAGIAMVSPMLAVPDMKSENYKMAKSLPERSSWWCFDTGSNVHLTGGRSLFVHLEEIRPESVGANVVGVAATTLTRIWVFEAKRPADAPRRSGVQRVIVNYTIADAQPDWTHECSVSQDHGGSWTRARHDDHEQAAEDV
ncbi:Zinc finger, CCHC-type [Plasmopara halstedii]|uniref:Zinc finger, CCHC-type n=1 Tax=Plasmopara halstedii TaxID=4781 RepID=A0A0P1AB35_PLAHL|nr:Zinc finger, CCHC-type [Plasmopara halstedii]CEG37806.1 Zinc finger, CCHC-type [Plasmopara halstedii]|eukprot:XP_024574175.1 Zinc finger, CCHC-type [Plasmopara halstedii]